MTAINSETKNDNLFASI